MTPKPIIILVPDEWHTPLHYARLTGLLNTYDYITIVPQLPTNGDEEPNVSLGDDVECVTSVLDNWVARQGREVLLVMHGYGGVVGGAAARSFLKTTMAHEGKEGGVVGIFYISAWVLPKGMSRAGFAKGAKEYERHWVQSEVITVSFLFWKLC